MRVYHSLSFKYLLYYKFKLLSIKIVVKLVWYFLGSVTFLCKQTNHRKSNTK